jgi:hypothetical protein
MKLPVIVMSRDEAGVHAGVTGTSEGATPKARWLIDGPTYEIPRIVCSITRDFVFRATGVALRFGEVDGEVTMDQRARI